jgi:hypothetical protein
MQRIINSGFLIRGIREIRGEYLSEMREFVEPHEWPVPRRVAEHAEKDKKWER